MIVLVNGSKQHSNNDFTMRKLIFEQIKNPMIHNYSIF